MGVKSSSSQYEWNMGLNISIVKIPETYLKPFVSMLENLELREKLTPREHYVSASKHPKWDENLEVIRNHVASLSSITSSDIIYFRIAEAGRLTITKDEFGPNEWKFAGIHVDSWDRRPLRHRHRSRNRLCINLSREPRYSLFINLPLMKIFNKLGLRDPQDIFEDFRGLTLGHRFLQLCPDYPVIRMRVDPGEAYILPTDNLLHDASTEGNRYPDITLTFLGYFSAPPV